MDVIDPDALIGQSIAREERFDSDPVGVWEELLAEVGTTRAEWIWQIACTTYDNDHKEVS